MNVLKNISSNNGMKISVHKVENQVNIPVVLSSNNILQPNDIFMTVKFL